jgi:phage terminase large subunit-like protein
MNGARMIALVAETQKDLEEVMIPRLLKVTPEAEAPDVRYKPVRIRWPNGAIAYGYNGTEPDQLRGPEFDTAWVDELAKYSKARETWDMLQFTMRRGEPRVLVTTTPSATADHQGHHGPEGDSDHARQDHGQCRQPLARIR